MNHLSFSLENQILTTECTASLIEDISIKGIQTRSDTSENYDSIYWVMSLKNIVVNQKRLKSKTCYKDPFILLSPYEYKTQL